MSLKRELWINFLKGIFFGLGTSVGLSVVLALLTYILNQLANLPGLQGIIDLSQLQKLLKQE